MIATLPVTRGAGYIGSNACKKLAENRFIPVTLNNRPPRLGGEMAGLRAPNGALRSSATSLATANGSAVAKPATSPRSGRPWFKTWASPLLHPMEGGLIAFSEVEESAAGMRAVVENCPGDARAARALAKNFCDAEEVPPPLGTVRT